MTLSKSKSQTQSSSLSFSVLICFDSRCPGGFSSNCAVLRSLAARLFSCCSCDSPHAFFSYFLYQLQALFSCCSCDSSERFLFLLSLSAASFFGINSLSSFLGCCHCRFFSHFTIKHFSVNKCLKYR